MIGNRPSSLPVARYCGLSPRLGEQHGAGREALLSNVFHAICAGKQQSVKRQWDGLTQGEQEELLTWKPPTDVTLPGGPTLHYAEAEKEVPCAVRSNFAPCRLDDPEAMTGGTLDFRWQVTAKDNTRVVFVADIKRTPWTCPEGPTSPQLLAYCLMSCAELDAEAYCPGLWFATTGEWRWAPKVTRLDSAQALTDMRLVKSAALNTDPRPVTGSHCDRCWSRIYCPEYTSPANEGLLGPALTQTLTPENALSALREVHRLSKLCELADENIKAAMVAGLKIVDETGENEYRTTFQRGRESFAVAEAKKLLDAATIKRLTTRGPDFATRRWVKT